MLNKIIYVFLFCFLSINIYSTDEEIEWAPSKLATEYKVEVRDFKSKEIKIKKSLSPKITKFKIDKLKEGLYEYRIGIITPKESVYTEWSSLSIAKSEEPEGAIDEFYFASLKEKYQEIYITGKNFVPDTKIQIFNKDYSIPIKKIIINSENELSFTLDLSEAKQGRYDLKIINPLNKVFDRPDFFIVDFKREDAEKQAKKVEKDDKIKKFGTEDKANASFLARSYFFRSAILPGWGQYAAGVDMDSKAKKWRGRIYMASSLVSLATFAYSYKEYRSRKDDMNDLAYLNNLVNQPFTYPLSIQGSYVNNQYNSNLDKLEKTWQTTARVGFFLVGIYAINLVDAYFFTGRKKGFFTVINQTQESHFQVLVYPERNSFGQAGTSMNAIYTFNF